LPFSGGEGAAGLYDTVNGAFVTTPGSVPLLAPTAAFAATLNPVAKTADLSFAASDFPRKLYLACGDTDGGETTNAWQKVVCLADVPAGATSLAGVALPVGSLSSVYRHYRAFMFYAGNFSASSYVQDGLTLQYDGVENVGIGQHADSTTTWVDLRGGRNLTLTTDDTVGADSVQIGKAVHTASSAVFSEYKPATFEIYARPSDRMSTWKTSAVSVEIPSVGELGWDIRGAYDPFDVMRPTTLTGTPYLHYRCYECNYSNPTNLFNGKSGLTNATAWSDGKVVHSGAIYEIVGNRTLRTIRDAEKSKCDFPGDGLAFGDSQGGTYINSLTLFGKGITIHGPCLVPEGAITRIWSGQGVSSCDVPVTAERIAVDGLLRMGAYNKSTLILDGPLSGNGEVVMEGVDSTGAFEGHYEFTDNSAFTGRLRLSLSATMIAAHNGTNQTWGVFRETDFGGARPAFDARGVTLEHGANLDISPPTTTNNFYAYTSPTNCGLLVNESANLSLPYARSGLTWLAPLTLNGTLHKTGSADLVLASPMKFLTAGGELTDTPTEGKNVITWEGGGLKALDCDAFNGAQVRLTAASQNGWVKLQLAVDYANENLTKYGIRNVKTDNPFAIANPSAFPKLPLDVTFPVEHPDGLEFTVGIMTVRAAAATGVVAMLPLDQLPRKIYKGYRQTAEMIDNGDGTVTLGVKFEQQGTVLLLR